MPSRRCKIEIDVEADDWLAARTTLEQLFFDIFCRERPLDVIVYMGSNASANWQVKGAELADNVPANYFARLGAAALHPPPDDDDTDATLCLRCNSNVCSCVAGNPERESN